MDIRFPYVACPFPPVSLSQFTIAFIVFPPVDRFYVIIISHFVLNCNCKFHILVTLLRANVAPDVILLGNTSLPGEKNVITKKTGLLKNIRFFNSP